MRETEIIPRNRKRGHAAEKEYSIKRDDREEIMNREKLKWGLGRYLYMQMETGQPRSYDTAC